NGALSVSGGTYQQGAGTVTGPQPVTAFGSSVSYAGSGAGTVVAHGATSLSGNIAASQTLVLEGICGNDATTTAAASFSNAGTLQLTSSNCGNWAQLTGSGVLLTNTGTLRADPGAGGARYLRVSVQNNGTLQANATVTYDQGGTTLTNAGTL